MAKKTIVTSQPVPVQEIKHDDIEKVKQVDTIKSIDPIVKKTKKVSTKKTVDESKQVKIQVPEPVVEEPVVPIVEPEPIEIKELEIVDENSEIIESNNDSIPEKKRVRRLVSKESFYKDFEEYVVSINQLLDSIKLEKGSKNNKNALVKKLKQLQNDCYKLLKLKHLKDDKKPKGDNNSGFMKPIKISNDLASFLNTDPNEPITRVQVTKKLCSYIKEKDLQNPSDRREILPDNELQKLFNLGNEKLTYYSMQKQIQQHIYKI